MSCVIGWLMRSRLCFINFDGNSLYPSVQGVIHEAKTYLSVYHYLG
jgi:hypothetical protein